MKEITTIIRLHILSKAINVLHGLSPFPGVTLLDVHGQGRGRGAGGAFLPTQENFTFYKKALLLINCASGQVDLIVKTIIDAAHTGHKGDGIVTIKEVTLSAFAPGKLSNSYMSCTKK
ncbi:MAG: P-II family nitrogen regulator [Opitutaceae bacterium]|nr:P-II family nitrogen regulator [Opitutaceae bacterium]